MPSAVEMVTCGRASKDFRIFMPQKLKNQSHAVLLPAHVMLLPVRRAGGLRVGMGGRVLGFGPVLNSIIGVNSRGFSADARSPNTATDRPTDRPTDRDRERLSAPAPAFHVHLSILAHLSNRSSSGLEMTKAYFSPLRKMMPPIGNSARASFQSYVGNAMHSFIPRYPKLRSSFFTDDLSAAEKDPELNLKGKHWGKQNIEPRYKRKKSNRTSSLLHRLSSQPVQRHRLQRHHRGVGRVHGQRAIPTFQM